MTYAEYIEYHLQGDAGVEERMIASLAKHYALSDWDAFRLIYFYTMTYHIPSALAMLIEGERDMKKLHFRTDRRYVRCNGAYDRLLKELSADKLSRLQQVTDTAQAYKEVSGWYFFGRYAAYLFLEVWCNVFKPNWVDNLIPDWEQDENYTKGAVSIVGRYDIDTLNKFLDNAKKDTKDNVFALETSLCAVEKFRKGTRYNGYYTERMLNEAAESAKYGNLIIKLAK